MEAEQLHETEAFRVLLGLARNKARSIPPEVLVRQVLETHRAADWPVHLAAMEALLRRAESARREALRVCSKPPGGEPFGLYETRRSHEPVRPYGTLLESLDPLEGRCDCPDFLRSSLGVCKHLFAVLDHVTSRPRGSRRALDRAAATRPAPRLTWRPWRPLTGKGDWMEQVALLGGANGGIPQRAPAARVQRWFVRGPGNVWHLRNTFLGRPRPRLRLVQELSSALPRHRGKTSAADPALRTLLREEARRLEHVVANEKDAGRLARALRSLSRKLYPYQIDGVRRLFAEGRLLLADDMGLGKTAQAVAACHALWRTGKVSRGLIVVPASLKSQWQREWSAFSDAPTEIVWGSADERRTIYRRRPRGFLIVNYEQILRDLDLVLEWNPGIVVLDEAQRIKNWATKTATCVKRLRPAYRLVLTGTPMENRIEELASIMDWIDDRALEPKWRLGPWHSVHSDGSKEVTGARNLDTLRDRLSHCMLRRRRSEILSQLPPRTDTNLAVELTPAQREEHDALNQPIAVLAHKARRRPLTQAEFLRLMSLLTTQRIIANGLAQFDYANVWPGLSKVGSRSEALLSGLSSPKLIELREIVTRIVVQQDRKVVVFSQWLRMLRLAHWAVEDVLRDHGLRAAFFTGRESQQQRTRNLVDLHDDPATRVLFATDAGGVGLNLQRAATACVNIELPWNPAVLEQRVGRIYRLGQRQPIDVYNLVSQDSIEARIATLVADKRALFRGLFDGDSNEIRFERSGNLLSRLEHVIGSGEAAPRPGPDPEPDEDPGQEERELDEMVLAADESRDAPEPEEPREPAASGEVALPAAPEIRRLFSELAIRPTKSGGLRIEASAEAAATLAALFEGMAQMLGRAERRP